MKPHPALLVILVALAALAVWLWQIPGDGDPWPGGRPHPRSSGVRAIAGYSVQFPPLAEAPRQALTTSVLDQRLKDLAWTEVVAWLGPPDERLSEADPPDHALWWSLARYDGDTGDTGWREPVVHLHLELQQGRVVRCQWVGGEARLLGAQDPVGPPLVPPPQGASP